MPGAPNPEKDPMKPNDVDVTISLPAGPVLQTLLEDAALNGAAQILCQRSQAQENGEISVPIEHMNLASLPGFKKKFARSIYLP